MIDALMKATLFTAGLYHNTLSAVLSFQGYVCANFRKTGRSASIVSTTKANQKVSLSVWILSRPPTPLEAGNYSNEA